MKLKKSDLYLSQLTALLEKYPALTWASESDYPLEVVKLHAQDIHNWPRSKGGSADVAMLRAGSSADWQVGWEQLVVAFIEPTREVMIKLDTEEPGVFVLYLLCRFGTVYVGIRTHIIET